MAEHAEPAVDLAPVTVHGDGAVARVPALVAEHAGDGVLLVCGRRSFEASGAAAILPALQRAGEVRRWSDFAPNPDVDDLLDGLKHMADLRPGVVLGVGGGSAMDMAKLLCAFDGVTDADALRAAIRDGGRVPQRGCRLCLVPTTSGSGSEATHFAVVYIGEEKFSVAGAAMRADTTVLDPQLTLTGSAYQRATSGIDAVCQAIESRWAVGATPRSRRLAREGLRLLLEHIEPFVHAPDSTSAHGMTLGSHLAGRAIDTSRTTAAHALSYLITKRYGVSHGHAVALSLGAFIEAHAKADPERLQPGVDATAHAHAMADVLDALDALDGATARTAFTALLQRVGLTPHLDDVGVTTGAQRAELAAAVNVERLGNNPVAFGEDELAALLA